MTTMKNIYIQSLLSEIQLLESKVAGLKDNQTVSFSFFKDAFKQTQEITRLLHSLEFVQIEDMKSQMEKLVHFLSQASEQTEPYEEDVNVKDNVDKSELQSDPGRLEGFSPPELIMPSKNISAFEIKEDYPQLDNKETKTDNNTEGYFKENTIDQEVIPQKELLTSSTKISRVEIKEDFPLEGKVKSEIKSADSAISSKTEPKANSLIEETTNGSQINNLNVASRSLNDMQPTNHTILDTKRSISLNDRFLFQRELFDNDRYAMNNMMIKMQAFATFAECKNYLENNTDWNFKDATVEKFLDLLKESF